MNDIIFGADGLVGRALQKFLPKATRYTHEDVDITSYEGLMRVFDSQRPKVVYLAAANTNVDACEDVNTGKVNIGGTLLVLRLCEMYAAKLVWFSSSYVFNGRSRQAYAEQAVRDPIQEYGKQKARVEQEILMSHHPALIIRTVGVFGPERGKKNFVKGVAAAVASKKIVMAPTDQYMNPILSYDLAETVVGLAAHHQGIYHVAGDDTMSKYEYARMVAGFFGKEKLIEGVTSDMLKQKALRPKMGALKCEELERNGFKIPSFQLGLERFLSEEYG